MGVRLAFNSSCFFSFFLSQPTSIGKAHRNKPFKVYYVLKTISPCDLCLDLIMHQDDVLFQYNTNKEGEVKNEVISMAPICLNLDSLDLGSHENLFTWRKTKEF